MKTSKKCGLYWLTNDLRIEDNSVLTDCAYEVDELLLVYCFDEVWFSAASPLSKAPSLGHQRLGFIQESLHDMNQQLKLYNQSILTLLGNPISLISKLITQYQITHLFLSQPFSYYENQQLLQIQKQHPELHIDIQQTQTLFSYQQLPFELSELPTVFSKFHKEVEDISPEKILKQPSILPLPFDRMPNETLSLPITAKSSPLFKGGENAAHEQLTQYFKTNYPSHYKDSRDALDGWHNSSKISAWLAIGNLSPKQVLQQLRTYEQTNGSNESTEWLYFELLWREYFQWYDLRYGKKVFLSGGINNQKVSCCFYPERFQKWANGMTPYPLVNACMKQLNKTGYISNRGRQIVASCLIHEMKIDWRYGAKYFEQKLVDYNAGSNWGNWQYLAGVGADSRGGRHFNIEKQTKLYDPQGKFIEKWQGNADANQPLDSVDAADWPI